QTHISCLTTTQDARRQRKLIRRVRPPPLKSKRCARHAVSAFRQCQSALRQLENPMNSFRFRILDLFVGIAAIAVVLSFWKFQNTNSYSPLSDNSRLIFAIYLGFLSTATITCIRFRPASFALGYAAFGWVYLITMLHGYFRSLDYEDL